MKTKCSMLLATGVFLLTSLAGRAGEVAVSGPADAGVTPPSSFNCKTNHSTHQFPSETGGASCLGHRVVIARFFMVG